jgi:preprotein translocase subunit YajC
MNVLSILLQTPAPQGGGSGVSMILMMAAIIAIFYFLMIRPQQKKQKDIQKAREALKPGDKVITAGGIYGKLKDVNDKDMVVEIADNIRVHIDRNSVFASAEDTNRK